MANWTALAPGTIEVRTARNMDVPIAVEVRDAAPNDDFEEWDKVFECSIDVPFGKMVIAGCIDYFPDADRIEVKAGSYRARIYYGELETLRKNDLEGDDHYKVVLWPAQMTEPTSLK
jgi:hypothetical protein